MVWAWWFGYLRFPISLFEIDFLLKGTRFESQTTKIPNQQLTIGSGQIIATSQDLGPQISWFSKGNGTPYFREI